MRLFVSPKYHHSRFVKMNNIFGVFLVISMLGVLIQPTLQQFQCAPCVHFQQMCLDKCGNDAKCLCNCWKIICPTCDSSCICFVPSVSFFAKLTSYMGRPEVFHLGVVGWGYRTWVRRPIN